MTSSSVVAAGGEPGAELVEDQAEAVRVRLAVDVVDEVEVDRLAVVLQRQEVLAGARLAVGDLLERAAAPASGRARLRSAEQSTNFSPSSDCGRIRQRGVAAEVLEAGVGDLEHDDRLAGVGLPSARTGSPGSETVDAVDRADLGAGDPHVLAVDEEAAVVEDGADHVGAPSLAAAGADREQRRPRAPSDGG